MLRYIYRLVPAVILLFASTDAAGAYGHQSFGSLYAQADLIALGHITEVNDRTFQFYVEEVFQAPAGETVGVGSRLVVGRFFNWKCAARWAPYRLGQRLLVFLRRSVSSADTTERWRALGAANEGEMPVEGVNVYIGGVGDGSPIKTVHTVYGARYPSQAFPLADVLAALRSRSIPDSLRHAPLGARRSK